MVGIETQVHQILQRAKFRGYRACEIIVAEVQLYKAVEPLKPCWDASVQAGINEDELCHATGRALDRNSVPVLYFNVR